MTASGHRFRHPDGPELADSDSERLRTGEV